MRGLMDRLRRFARKRPKTSLAIAGLLVFLSGVGVGVAGTNDTERIRELEDENADLRAAQEQLRESAEEVNKRLLEFEDEAITARADARKAEERLRTADQRAGRMAEQELSDRSSELDQRESQLDERESEIRRVERSNFGDGTWEVGADITPGTYRARGGAGCYWERLREPGGSGVGNIIANEVGVRNPTVTLDSGWFRTDDCDKWQLIR